MKCGGTGRRHRWRRTIRLTTVGRRSGRMRTVTLWYVDDGPSSILVQHVAAQPAGWYANLLNNPNVWVDFGDGRLPGRAQPIRSPEEVREVLRRIRRKYPLAWLLQLRHRRAAPVAARITFAESSGGGGPPPDPRREQLQDDT